MPMKRGLQLKSTLTFLLLFFLYFTLTSQNNSQVKELESLLENTKTYLQEGNSAVQQNRIEDAASSTNRGITNLNYLRSLVLPLTKRLKEILESERIIESRLASQEQNSTNKSDQESIDREIKISASQIEERSKNKPQEQDPKKQVDWSFIKNEINKAQLESKALLSSFDDTSTPDSQKISNAKIIQEAVQKALKELTKNQPPQQQKGNEKQNKQQNKSDKKKKKQDSKEEQKQKQKSEAQKKLEKLREEQRRQKEQLEKRYGVKKPQDNYEAVEKDW